MQTREWAKLGKNFTKVLLVPWFQENQVTLSTDYDPQNNSSVA